MKTYTHQLPSSSSIRAYLFKTYSPMDMGWSVVEGEGVADKLGGGASVDVEPPLLELAERLSLKESHKHKSELSQHYYL